MIHYSQLCMVFCILAISLSKLGFNHLCAMIKTHGSESRGQEEAAIRDERVSYLHVALL